MAVVMLQIEVVNEMPGLPYSEPYGAWADHIDVCELCHAVLAAHILAGRVHPSELLCPAGRDLDTTLNEAMERQHQAAVLN
jgi:hypothetical protein